MKTSPQPLVAQDAALSAFFDAMLYVQTRPTPASAPDVAADGDAAVEAGANASQRPAPEPDSIQALLFEVAGLTLALPVQAVKDVISDAMVEASVTEQRAIAIGTFNHGGISCRVIDTARLVLSAERAAQLTADAAERTRCLVVIGDGRWALGCNRKGDVVELERASIKWRTAEGKRPWLAGMVTARQCALLDPTGLTLLLDEQMA